jgi:hypothetical protein
MSILIKYDEEIVNDSYEYYMGLVELIELNGVLQNEILGRIIDECING